MLMLTEEIETFLWKGIHNWKNQKKLSEVSKPLHLSTNPEILVKIAPLVSWATVARKSTIKKKFKK